MKKQQDKQKDAPKSRTSTMTQKKNKNGGLHKGYRKEMLGSFARIDKSIKSGKYAKTTKKESK